MSLSTLFPRARRALAPIALLAVAGLEAAAQSPLPSHGGASTSPSPPTADAGSTSSPGRIVSLAPSLTETLFALGLGDRVVGVSRYCAIPAGSPPVPRVGGYLDPDYETIVSLEPDLVALIEPQREAETRLAELGLHTLRVDQGRLDAILTSFEEIAAACGVPDRGRRLRAVTESRLEALSRQTTGDPPRVLIAVERPLGGGRVTSFWAAAPDTFLDDLLRVAGAVNVVPPGPVPFPELSREGLIALDPDVILDLQPTLADRAADTDEAAADWRALAELRAVRAGRVHVLTDDALVIPGPRVADAVEILSRAIVSGRP